MKHRPTTIRDRLGALRGLLRIPAKTNALMGRMNENSHSYVRAEEEEMLTFNWHCVGEKRSATTSLP